MLPSDCFFAAADFRRRDVLQPERCTRMGTCAQPRAAGEHFLDALRAAALGNPAAVIQRLFYLAISAILAIALAALTFRWDPDRGLFSRAALARP